MGFIDTVDTVAAKVEELVRIVYVMCRNCSLASQKRIQE